MKLKEEVKEILRKRQERIRYMSPLFKNNMERLEKDKIQEKQIQTILDLLD